MESLMKFKCSMCGSIPAENEVNQCIYGHIICIKCEKKNSKCSCACERLNKVPNPIVNVVSNTVPKFCPFKEHGCTWIFANGVPPNDHTMECKFRPYLCIGKILGVWNCDWIGRQHECADHMKTVHHDNVEHFLHYQKSKVDFDMDKTNVKINLIDAFNKNFIFFYLAHAESSNIIFIIFLMGRKCDAEKYLIDFELKDGVRKLKFIEACYSDAGNLRDIITEYRCSIIPKGLAQTYAKDGKLEFRFALKRKDAVEAENAIKQKYLKNNVLNNNNNNTEQLETMFGAMPVGNQRQISNNQNVHVQRAGAKNVAGINRNRTKSTGSLNKQR